MEGSSIEQLRVLYKDSPLYNAGIPYFSRNFSRDSLITGLLMNSTKVLRGQLHFSSKMQGKKKDPFSGEEPGKIHHEYPGVKIRGHSTLFNACDTTALYLIGMETYLALTDDLVFAQKHSEKIRRAVEYITAHISNGLFWEDPVFCGARKFALKVTYWKDSQLPHEKEEPRYPIAYLLAHFQNAKALKSASLLLNQSNLFSIAQLMTKAGFDALQNRNNIFVAIDKDGPIGCLSSDFLHVLAYLDPNDLESKKFAARVEAITKSLETSCGYRSVSPDLMHYMKDQYHSGAAVWVFEQALIHYGAKKFGFSRIEEISSRVRRYLDTDPEILWIGPAGEISKIGCDPQLWTIAAKHYFDKKISLAAL